MSIRRPSLPFLALLVALAGFGFADDVYKLREAADYKKERGGADAPNVVTSEHFAIKWGKENKLNFPITPAYLKTALAYFETVRDLYVNKLGFPLWKSDKEKFKTNIYITQTGLKPFLEGYAFGFADPEGYGVFIGEPSIMVPGHPAAAHELAHSFQAESGGFRDSDYVGWFWECHAQFMAHQANPNSLPEVLDNYVDTASFDWSSTRHHYGSWIFLQYLMERKGFGIGFINGLWLQPRRFLDEDPVLKIIRLGKLGSPGTGWADLFGDYAKRNVTFASYARGAKYLASLKAIPERNVFRSRTLLELDPDWPGWLRVPYVCAPQQNAYNVVALQPTARSVKVDFDGMIDPRRRSAWRNTLVAVDGRGRERFGKTWNQGVGTITLKPDEREIYLVSAATPGVYKHIKFLEDQRTQDRFPYRVKLSGATRAALIRAALVGGHMHKNGGGFVADSAHVDRSAYVGPGARVLGQARVSGRARVLDWATIDGSATVGEHAVVSDNALVTDHATVKGFARVSGYARVYDGSNVEGNARVYGFARLLSRAKVFGNAVVKDYASLWGPSIGGDAIVMGGADPGPGVRDCHKGVYTIFVGQEDCDKAEDFGGLLARYDFEHPHAFLLRDPFASNEGLLVGAPRWTAGSLLLDGKGQSVELPASLFALRSAEVALSVNWDGKPGTLLEFCRDTADAFKLALGADGKATVVLHGNGRERRIEGAGKPAARRWVDLRLVFDGKAIALFAGQEKILDSGPIGFAPEDVRATTAYLGRGFKGSVRAFSVARGMLN